VSTALLVLVLALPLLGALAAVAVGRHGGRVAASAALATLGTALWLALDVAGDGAVSIAVGDWTPPLGIRLTADGPAVLFLATTAVIMTAVVLYARHWITGPGAGVDRGGPMAHTFWALLLLLWSALNVIFVSRDLFNLYVGLELVSLTAVALVGIEGRRETLAAALRYLLFALTGSLLYLLGAALLYSAHGTLDLGLLAGQFGRHPSDLLALAAMTAGLAAKTALFPFHVWLPPAHAGAPPAASAVLSALVPKASLYILLRLWFDAAPDGAGPIGPLLLGALGAAAVLHGSLMALRQQRLKLIVAYSTVAQLGYLFLVFPLVAASAASDPAGADAAWRGTLFQALSHALAKAAMFLCAGLVIEAAGHDRLDRLAGTARALPITLFAFGLAAISLMGLPPSGGFVAKLLLIDAAFASGKAGWALVVLVGGLLAAAYLFRPLAAAWRSPDGEPDFARVARRRQVLPMALAVAALGLGLFSAGPAALMGGLP
jgi:formate hydrogenlyase subunit 3/multisubunit Na+/H+ antiporter MnhD subunit